MRQFTAAAAAYPIEWHEGWDSFAAKITAWVAEAKADLLVFPEYGLMELSALDGPKVAGDLTLATQCVAKYMPQTRALFQQLAKRHQVYILAPSAPVTHDKALVNRAYFYSPDGQEQYQDKQIMTRYERAPWGMSGARPLKLFDTSLGKIGVLICYDAEFPLLGRALVEAGAEVILCPSCTEALAGYWRVRIGAMARALEGQCVTLHAPTVGDALWSPAVDGNTGAAAIYGPPDHGFPGTGVLAEGVLNDPGWVRATVDRDAIARVRADGGVLNMTHWPEQSKPGAAVTVTAF